MSPGHARAPVADGGRGTVTAGQAGRTSSATG